MQFFLWTDVGGIVCTRIKPSYTGSKNVSKIGENAIGPCKNETHKCSTNTLHQYLGYMFYEVHKNAYITLPINT